MLREVYFIQGNLRTTAHDYSAINCFLHTENGEWEIFVVDLVTSLGHFLISCTVPPTPWRGKCQQTTVVKTTSWFCPGIRTISSRYVTLISVSFMMEASPN